MEETIISVLKCSRCYETSTVTEVGRKRTDRPEDPRIERYGFCRPAQPSLVPAVAHLNVGNGQSNLLSGFTLSGIKRTAYWSFQPLKRHPQLRIREVLLLFIPRTEVALLFWLGALWELPRTAGVLAVQSAP